MSLTFVHDIALVLGVAALAAVLLRTLRQPSVLGYLGAGLIVGPYTPVPLFADVERVQVLSEFGVILVMFGIGLEFRINKLVRVLPVSGFAGLIQMASLFWLGAALGRVLGWSTVEGLFLGASIAISSTMVVSRVFDEHKVQEDLRGLVFGILVLQDLMAIVLIALVTAVAEGATVTGSAVGWVVGRLLAVLVLMAGLGLLVVPRLIRAVVAMKSPETLIVVATGVCFSFALIAEELGYSVALGAFLAGMLVAESGRAHDVEHDLRPLRDVFGAVFFVAVGMTVDPHLVFENLPVSLLVFAGVVVAQLLSVTVGGLLSGNGLRRSMHAGLALGQVGEFAFIIAGIGTAAGVVRPSLAPVLVTVAVLTTFTTPLAVRHAPGLVGWVDRRLPARLQSWLVLYTGWFQRLRDSRPLTPRSPTRRAVQALALDGLGVVAVVLVWRGLAPRVEPWLAQNLDLKPAGAAGVLAVTAFVLAVPPSVGLVRNTQRVSETTGRLLFPDGAEGPAGQVWHIAMALLAVLSVGVPAAALLRPVSSFPFALVLVLVIAGVVAAALWRAMARLDTEVRSSTEAVVALLGQTALAVGGAEDPTQAPSAPSPVLMPPHIVLHVPPGPNPLVGRSLAQLDLRVRTGATVLAIHRPGRDTIVPTGSETIRADDQLVVVGGPEALEAMQELLRSGPSEAEPQPD